MKELNMGNISKQFTPVSNTLLETLIQLDINKRALKVILLIIRLTYGCNSPWAKVRNVDLIIAGIEETHAKEVISKLLTDRILLQNGKTKEFKINESYLASKVTKTGSSSAQRLRKLIGRHLPRTSQNSNPKLTEKVSNDLPKGEVYTSQNSNPDPLLRQEVSASDNKGFATSKDILKNKVINSDKESIADKKSPNEGLQVKHFNPTNSGETAALDAWRKIEPHNLLAFKTTYLWAYKQGLPASYFYQFVSEVQQDGTIGNKGAVFRKKVDEYLNKKDE